MVLDIGDSIGKPFFMLEEMLDWTDFLVGFNKVLALDAVGKTIRR